MSDYDDISAVDIGNGSGTTRAGFAGDEEPICVKSTVIGRPRSYTKCEGMDSKDYFVGDEAQKRRGVLSLDYPIEHGVITNWDHMELIWHHIYNSYLVVPPEEYFRKFKAPAFYVSIQGVLSSYWSGRGSAIMLEIGDGVTHTVPVSEGYSVQPVVKRLDLGGSDLTSYLQTLLHEKGHDFVTTGDFEVVREMKEKMSYVAEDYSNEITRSECFPDVDKAYKLPDGNCITIGKERFECPEMVFRPSKGRLIYYTEIIK